MYSDRANGLTFLLLLPLEQKKTPHATASRARLLYVSGLGANVAAFAAPSAAAMAARGAAGGRAQGTACF